MNERGSPSAAGEPSQERGQLHAFYDPSSPVNYSAWRPAGYWARTSSPTLSTPILCDGASFSHGGCLVPDSQPSCSSAGAAYADLSPRDYDGRRQGASRAGFRRKTDDDVSAYVQENRATKKPARYGGGGASGSQGGSGKKERTGGAGGGKHGERGTPAKNRGGSGKENRQLIAERNKKLPPKKRIRLH